MSDYDENMRTLRVRLGVAALLACVGTVAFFVRNERAFRPPSVPAPIAMHLRFTGTVVAGRLPVDTPCTIDVEGTMGPFGATLVRTFVVDCEGSPVWRQSPAQPSRPYDDARATLSASSTQPGAWNLAYTYVSNGSPDAELVMDPGTRRLTITTLGCFGGSSEEFAFPEPGVPVST